MDRRSLLVGTSGALAASLSGCLGSLFGGTVTESFSNSYTVSDETTLAVSNGNGPVTVEHTDKSELTVRGKKRAESQDGLDEISVDAVEGEQFLVGVSFGSGSDLSGRSVDLTVEVPESVTVDSIETANGDVSVEDVSGDVAATTSNGDVEVRDVDGYVECDTSNGDVEVRGATGLDGARTSNGSVDGELLAMRGDVTCRSQNGPVTIRVGPEVSAAFRLSTSNGDVRVTDLSYTVSQTGDALLEGSLRGGEKPHLTGKTTNGDVVLRSAET